MANKKIFMGILALMMVFGMATFVVSCGGDEDDGGKTPGVTGKPTLLTSSATAAQALAKVNEIIAYSGTPPATKTAMQSMKDSWTSYSSEWSTRSAYYI